MFKRACILFATVSTLFAAGRAHAGYEESSVVAINGNLAWGSLAGTHNSADNSRIMCTVTSTPAGSQVLCYAISFAGKEAVGSCVSTAPEIIQTARSIGASDYIEFTWNKASECTSLVVQHTSAVGAPNLAVPLSF